MSYSIKETQTNQRWISRVFFKAIDDIQSFMILFQLFSMLKNFHNKKLEMSKKEKETFIKWCNSEILIYELWSDFKSTEGFLYLKQKPQK